MVRHVCIVALAAAGCGRTPTFFSHDDAGGDGSSGALEMSTSTGELNCEDSPQVCVAELTLRRAVDILFVVDNSGSMGGEQGALARSFGTFVNVLEAQQVGANYRIGVTTTEGDGGIRATSCRSRLDDFESMGLFGDYDERQRGCLDHCFIDSIGLAQPWVEKSNGQTNLPNGISMAQALQCIGPQGISGWGFEAPLEAMRRTVVDDTDGFLRNDALLAVIFVTDEADCSAPVENISWMSTEQGMPFWTTPDRVSSGSCWKAGVQCSGGPGVFEDCIAVDKSRTGNITTNPNDSVLYPVERYIDTLTTLAAQKQAQGGQSEVLIAVLAGVPLDHPETGNLVYADSPDEQFNQEYGIGPGCGLGTETLDDPPGIPPVRLREFAEAFASQTRNLFSICADDYGVALQNIAGAIGEVNARACVGGCVRDLRYDQPGLQHNCTLVETFADATPDRPVEPCLLTELGWEFPSPQIDVCYRALTDPSAATPEATDDMSAQCVTLRSNLELLIQRRDGIPVPAGTAVQVSCGLEAPVGVTCDEL
ncbi:MAG: VWA domain-containing protein [Deltaproteobacteria bacterium]|nr:VWA domain-containing protein [Deltaproteobacteria bacterium]